MAVFPPPTRGDLEISKILQKGGSSTFWFDKRELKPFLAREGKQVLGQFLVGAVSTLPVMASNKSDKNT